LILWIVHAYYTVLLLFFLFQYSVNDDFAISIALFFNIFWNVLFVSISVANLINELRCHFNDQSGRTWPISYYSASSVTE